MVKALLDSPKLFISHESALEFWRHHDLSPSGGIRHARNVSVRQGTSSLAQIKPLARNAMPTSGRIYGARREDTLLACLDDLDIETLPLHVTIGERRLQRQSQSIVTHYYKQPFPEKSFCQVGPNVYVSSPELTLCQLASTLPYADLLELCLEFCGGYVLNPDSERGFDDRPAITSARKLAMYVDRYGGRHGAKILRRFLRYVIDSSASPMESRVLMLLCLPSRLGGYQLPIPQHNVVIPITEQARSHTSRKHLICDLYWSQYRLDVECDSTRYHSSKEQLGIDSDRRIILDAMHYSYVGITTWQLEHAEEFANVVQAIRRAMGRKLRNAPEHVQVNRETLRQYLTTAPSDRMPLRLIEK